jgi:hypothetical protein
MTIVIAWVRNVSDCEELVFVSDSRLSGDGRFFDACPKILTLPRSDCAIAYAGHTGDAFPMMLQFQRAIESYSPSLRGSLDIRSLLTHALKVFDKMTGMIQRDPHVSAELNIFPQATFVFGGYSWLKKRFELWTIKYNTVERRFEAHPSNWIGISTEAGSYVIRRAKYPRRGPRYNTKVCFAGDASKRAQTLLLDKLNARKAGDKGWLGMDWEPFETVRDMLRDHDRPDTIGGAPQVVKVYQYMHSASLGVFWPNKRKKQIYLQGRPCLGYERIENWILDPDTLRSERFAIDESQFMSAVEAATKHAKE